MFNHVFIYIYIAGMEHAAGRHPNRPPVHHRDAGNWLVKKEAHHFDIQGEESLNFAVVKSFWVEFDNHEGNPI